MMTQKCRAAYNDLKNIKGFIPFCYACRLEVQFWNLTNSTKKHDLIVYL